MKKLLMIGTAVAFMLTMGTAAFAANTGRTDGPVNPRAAECAFVDEDGDGICDNCGRYCLNDTGSGRSSCCGHRGNCR